MQRRRALVLFAASIAFISRPAAGLAQGATPTFTVTASSVTMPSSGTGTVAFALASVNGWAGQVVVSCAPPNPPTGAIVPECNYAGGGLTPAQPPIPLAANGTATGSVNLVAEITPCNPCPASLPIRPQHRRVPSHGRPVSLALAGALLLGLGLRRRAARWLTLTLMTVATLGGLAGIGACGSSGKTLTPGTYAYTITGVGTLTGTIVALSENTSVNVIVPSGIPTNLSAINP